MTTSPVRDHDQPSSGRGSRLIATPTDPEEASGALWQEVRHRFAWYDRAANRNRWAYYAVKLMFLVGAHGIRTWRGQQYALALFPLWIKACWTSAANVWFKRPLGFVVTPKERRGRAPIPWREIWPQLTAMVVLVVAAIIGVLRVIAGTADGVGTLVNTVWVVYDLVVLSIIPRAALYRGPAAPALEKESPLP